MTRSLAWPLSILMVLFCLLGAGCFRDEVEDRYAAGLELLFHNHHEDAESHFLLLARQMERSNLPDASHWQARALVQAGRIDHLYLDQPRRALARFREALKVDPQATFAFEVRREIAGIFYDRLMDYRTAALEYERLVHEYPEEAGIDGFQYRVAQSYFLVRDFDQARTEARMLFEKWPEGRYAPEALLLIANSYYLENRFAEAVEAHRRLLELGPDVPIRARSLFELGVCYQDLGDKAKAEESFLAALKDHPRPDLVQMQLSALRERIDAEDEGARPLSYATAAKSGKQAADPVGAQPAPKPAAKPAPRPKSAPSPKPSAKVGESPADGKAKTAKPKAQPAPTPEVTPKATPKAPEGEASKKPAGSAAKQPSPKPAADKSEQTPKAPKATDGANASPGQGG